MVVQQHADDGQYGLRNNALDPERPCAKSERKSKALLPGILSCTTFPASYENLWATRLGYNYTSSRGGLMVVYSFDLVMTKA